LLRRWKSVPLPSLTQGATVSITSSLTDATNVVILPEWRDSGHVELVQRSPLLYAIVDKSIPEIEMTVTREADLKTPLGRYEPHVSIRLSRATATSDTPPPSDDAEGSRPDTPYQYLPSKAIERVMLDDGSIHPDSQAYTSLPRGMRRVEYHDGMAHITEADDDDDDDAAATVQLDEAAADGGRDSPSSSDAASAVLTIRIPEKVNVTCDLRGADSGSSGGGSISVQGKLEGNVRLMTCGGGDISVTKLRGHVIELESIGKDETARPSILVRDLVEAQSFSVACTGRFRAKQIHGRSIKIDVDHRGSSSGSDSSLPGADSDDELSLVDVGALFVSGGRNVDDGTAGSSGGGGGASIRVKGHLNPSPVRRRAVRVKSHHGALEVFAEALGRPSAVDPYTHETYPLVELGGANGSFEVTIHGVSTALPSPPEQEWTSCKVHVDSLHPESVSLVTSEQGDVELTLDRKAETDLRLLSTSSSSTLREVGAAVAEEEDPELLLRLLERLPRDPLSSDASQSPRIAVQTAAFTCSGLRFESDDGSIAYRDGYVVNKSHEPDSRFDRRSQGMGKIRLDGAEAQALQGFVKRADEERGDTETPSDAHDGAQTATGTVHPLVAVASTGRISVETVSWIGAIARRYGLDDDSPRGIGRTASRRGRSIAAATDDQQ
jgi:hypothetical protein